MTATLEPKRLNRRAVAGGRGAGHDRPNSKGQSLPRPPSDQDPSTYLGRVAIRLKALRESAGMDQEAAAKAITHAGYQVSESTVYRWEQGVTQPHIEALPAIAKAYGVTSRVVLPPS